MRLLWQMTLAALILCAAAWADTEVDRTCDAALEGRVHIANTAGSVTVKAWDASQVQVTGTLGNKVKELVFSASGDNITIKVVVPKRGGRGIEAHLTVSVPRASRLDIDAVSAEVRVLNVEGQIEAATVSGALAIDQAKSPVKASSISGDVSVSANAPSVSAQTSSGKATVSGTIAALEAETVSGGLVISAAMDSARIKTVSGDVRVEGSVKEFEAEAISGDISVATVLGEVEASTVSGRIAVGGQHLSEGKVFTVSGGVNLRGDLAGPGDVRVETRSGRVEVRVPESPTVRYDISTLSGDIQNEFGPPPQRVDQFGPGLRLGFGPEAGPTLRIETLSGGIALRRP